jgi:outer membrane protein
MWKLVFTGIGIALLLPVKSQSQDTTQLQWDLQTCLQYAQKNNVQINALRLEQRLREQDYLLARAARIPDLAASVSQSLVNSTNTDPIVGGFQTQADYSANYSLSSAVTVFNGGYIKRDIQQKNLQIQSAGLNIQEAQNDITLQITQAYLNILLSKENIANLQEIVATTRDQVELSRQRYRAGSIARRDLLQLEAQLASNEYNLVAEQNNLRQNIITLKQILLLPSSVSFDVVQPDTLYVEQVVPSLPTAVNTAMTVRPEVKNAELGITIAELDLAKARAGFWPTISAGGSLSSGYSDNRDEKYFPQLRENFYQRLGLTVSVPIFSNRINRTNVERSKILIDQARLSLQDTRTALDLAIEQAYVNVLNAQEQYRAAEVQWNANREAYNITNEELRLGAINTLDLLQQKSLYIQALQAYTQAKYMAVMNVKIYNFYTGVPVTLP